MVIEVAGVTAEVCLRYKENEPDCAKCPFLPRCTPFKRRGCPNWFEQCSVERRLDEEDYLRELLRGAVTEAEADDEDDDDRLL